MRDKLLKIIHSDDKHFYDEEYIVNFNGDLQGWDSEAPVFKSVLEKINPKLIVEVGTWKGASAIHFASLCKELKYDAQILCVDTWLGSEEYYTNLTVWHPHLLKKAGYPSVYYTFLRNVVDAGFKESIIPFPTTSIIAAKVLKHHNIYPDIIYLDASHDYESVYMDLELYYDILNNGGYLIGDDYSSTWQGVVDACADFCMSNNLPVDIIGSKFVIKKNDN